jgi:hypothetical protein
VCRVVREQIRRGEELHTAVAECRDFLWRQWTRLAAVVLSAVLEPDLDVHMQQSATSPATAFGRGKQLSLRKPVWGASKVRTCTSFSFSETRLTISRRAVLSGFGLAW